MPHTTHRARDFENGRGGKIPAASILPQVSQCNASATRGNTRPIPKPREKCVTLVLMPGKNKVILQPIDIAVALDISPWSARRLCRDGAFPGAFLLGEVGSQWRIPREDLEAFIQHRREETVKHSPVKVNLPPTAVW